MTVGEAKAVAWKRVEELFGEVPYHRYRSFTYMMRALGREDLGELRLEFLGSSSMSPADVERLFRECASVYDRAVVVHRKPVPFGHDLCPAARRFMIDGARDILDRGYHREALGWICFAHWIAHNALESDIPEEYERSFRPAYQRLLDALGIGSLEALERKAPIAKELLSRTMEVAESILAGNPAVVHS
jgi:hypothetical protein